MRSPFSRKPGTNNVCPLWRLNHQIRPFLEDRQDESLWLLVQQVAFCTNMYVLENQVAGYASKGKMKVFLTEQSIARVRGRLSKLGMSPLGAM